MKKLLYIICTIVPLLVSCKAQSGTENSHSGGDTLTSRAELLTLVDHGDYVAAIVADPWNDGKVLASYALVNRNSATTPDIPAGYTKIDVPLTRSIVDSSTNSAAIAELGAVGSIAAVADGVYYNEADTIARLLSTGDIVDIGSSMSPKVETIVEVSPDAILSSPYQNAGHGVIATIGVPIIECADYMEPTPLGRAEWILFLGELYGARDKAATIYKQVADDYTSLSETAAAASSDRPKVLPEMLTSGVWYVPGGKSYMAQMLSDAGAEYPWADNASSGSLQLDIAAVIDKASDADIWYMRNYGTPTLSTLKETSPLYAGIKAYKDGEVYNCDTSTSTIFNDIAFHPERILADFIAIFHPETMPQYTTVYFKKISSK